MGQLKEDFRLICRGIGVIHRLSPYNLLAKCVRSVCNATLPFVNLYFSAAIIDALVGASSSDWILKLVLLTLGLNLALVLLSKAMDAVNYEKWNEFYPRYNFSLGEKAQSLLYEEIEDYRTHLMIKNIDDAMKIGNYGLIKLHSRIPLFVENFLKVCFSVGLTLSVVSQKMNGAPTALQRFANSPYADVILSLLIVCSGLSCVLANKRIALRTYDRLGKLSKSNRIFDYYLTHYLDSHRAGKDIRLYRQDAVILDEIDRVGENNTGIVNSMNRGIFRCQSLIALSNFALLLYTYLYVGFKAMTGLFAVGSIVKYSSGVLQFSTAFSDMMDAFSQLRANSPYLRDYFRFIDFPAEPQQAGASSPSSKKVSLLLEARHVSFRYPGTEEYVLKDVSFTIRPGEKVAIVGLNGSGKTTMIKLICRLYEPTDGAIFLNGKDIRDYDLQQYLSLLGVVFQDFKLFSFTLGQNVAAGIHYDPARVKNCLRQAGLEKRLHSMAQGLDTYLYKDFDENGVEISGGEAQKIALARALYQDAPLIILDEPTAALDPVAEEEIYSKFHEMVQDKTAIFISHRLSSCRFCTQILVFAEGKLVQRGDHAALLQDKEGVYAKLWTAQAQYYQE